MMETPDKRLVLSILQELTVSALDLFDPHQPMGAFLERVSERMGCLAVLVLDEAAGTPRLLDAAGLSAASRQLPLAAGPLSYPELADPGLVTWRFELRGGQSLVLCFEREPPSAAQYRGMMRRLADIFQTALGHRLLYGRTLDSEESARRAIQAREELIEVVSHDLKGPLTTISMSVEELSELLTPATGSEVERSLARIQRSADRMSRLIRDLLDLAKLDHGHLAITPAPLELTTLFGEAVELSRAQLSAKSLRLEQRIGPGAERVHCDRERILQVLANLLGNAIKFTVQGGITIAAERRDGEVVLSVRDTGPGIPDDQRAHLFDRFWQAPGTAHQGTGLGLSIAKGLVELHGGRIWAQSEVGAGSTFFFTLAPA
jgi:signal transduction histidine kinase